MRVLGWAANSPKGCYNIFPLFLFKQKKQTSHRSIFHAELSNIQSFIKICRKLMKIILQCSYTHKIYIASYEIQFLLHSKLGVGDQLWLCKPAILFYYTRKILIDSFHLNDRTQLRLCAEYSMYLLTLGVIRLTIFDQTGFESQSGELTLTKISQYKITLSFFKKAKRVQRLQNKHCLQ